jgi:hypothetical protein
MKSEGLSFEASIGDSPAIDLTSNKYAGKYPLCYILFSFNIFIDVPVSSLATCL